MRNRGKKNKRKLIQLHVALQIKIHASLLCENGNSFASANAIHWKGWKHNLD